MYNIYHIDTFFLIGEECNVGVVLAPLPRLPVFLKCRAM
jgi:hypothetical protein